MTNTQKKPVMLEAVESLAAEDEDLENCNWTQTTKRLPQNIYLPSPINSAERIEEDTHEPKVVASEEDEIHIAIVCLACAVIVATVAFNSILLYLAIRRRLYHEVSCQLAMSQSIVDLLLALVIMPIHFMVDLRLSDLVMSIAYFCEFWSSADVFLCTLSILHQLGMCFEKFLTMRGDNFEKFRHRFMIYTVVFMIISASVATPLLFDCQTAVTATFVIASTTTSYYIPTTVMLFLIAGISFHTFQAHRCKQCKTMNYNHDMPNNRHVVFNAITLHWRNPVVKSSVSMPFFRHTGGMHHHFKQASPSPIPLAVTLNGTKQVAVDNPLCTKQNCDMQRKSDTSTCSDCSLISVVEEIEVAKTAALLALPTRLPCTRTELMHFRSKHDATKMKPRMARRVAGDYGSYVNPCFDAGSINSATTLQLRRMGGGCSSGSSAGSVITHSSGSDGRNYTAVAASRFNDKASEKQPLIATSRKPNRQDGNSFLKHLQTTACHHSNHRACFEAARAKALRTTASTFICVTCWFPFFTLFILFFVLDAPVPNLLFRAALWLGYMNGILNPLFYILGKRRMRF